MPTVYGANASPFVRKVRVVLSEKNIPYELEPVFPGPMAPPEFRTLSPLNKIPAFRDGDKTKDLKPRPYLANRLYSHLKDFFTWCARPNTGSIKMSPMIGVELPFEDVPAEKLHDQIRGGLLGGLETAAAAPSVGSQNRDVETETAARTHRLHRPDRGLRRGSRHRLRRPEPRHERLVGERASARRRDLRNARGRGERGPGGGSGDRH